ncbi:MAG: hydantoinase/oxoprolinase family protein [Gammaproteobacteria bacterium]|nr:MAG: hydantoinase/oxoprolinase family protein [Gammaproteobacteria bacterium]
MRRVSVDIGGTFTDCFLVFDNKRAEGKALTTHHNLASGFMASLEDVCGQIGATVEEVLSTVDAVRYATTLGTNALIERKGPDVGLLTTSGYEFSVPLMRARGYGDGLSSAEQQDLAGADRPAPIVPRSMIEGVDERVDYKGDVVFDIDEDNVRDAVRRLVDRGAQAFVVSTMNSVVNPINEKKIERIILEEYPSHLLGALPIILSHRVAGRKGEYARTMSAVLDAYLHDQMYHGLASLESVLRKNKYPKPMLVVHNSCGMAQMSSTHSLQTIHSGPVAGLEAANSLSSQFDEPNVIATDMGGTSFDIGLVTSDGVKFYDFNPIIDRWLISTPMSYLHTLGAGGGSIARFDRVWGAVEVGPQSAGSDPGPACYGRGGKLPTTTDANLVLGYLDEKNYAGGSIKLSKRRAERSIRDHICEHAGLSVEEAALAIRRKVDANMADAIFKEVAVKGYDPRNFTLLSYGGGGPLHACGYASKIGISQILIPPFSAVFSALGAGSMDQLHIHERSLYLMLYDAMTRTVLQDFTEFNATVGQLEVLGREDLLRQGVDPKDIKSRVELDMRYGNQLAQTAVVSPVERIESDQDVMTLLDLFSSNYEQRFGKGSAAPEAGIRVNVIRVVSYVEHETVLLENSNISSDVNVTPTSSRDCWFDGTDGAQRTQVYNVTDIPEGASVDGPALVETPHTTYLVYPDWSLTMGKQGSARLQQHSVN